MSKKVTITKKRHLEMMLQQIPPHKSPKVHLEQYTTPSNIASDILWNAYSLGDIKDKKVIDLGCGTGIFAIGSVLLGAREVTGVDIDPGALEIARTQASKMGVEDDMEFISRDIQDFAGNADTVIQNPPFGAQKTKRKEADRIFMTKSMEIAPVVYSFHILETEPFVERFFNKLGGCITHKFSYSFPIPRTYHFHEKEKIDIDVIVLRIQKKE
ncbi:MULTISPECIES: METTL5 family protein [Methanobacterium]|uniref:METTL5 family protein n=1 Tax=Methanobacterium veterum TaxID=408577 RepID=A0A9E4ZW11_9EURY|nr:MULTISPECIES: METTL5 family protein [Methanobacterium]MCZ3364673.1 METTL5 family protein [Methanobacterium veterum]MCZ3372427.1 METTL5 family protein [Methanobacterium veterum]